MNALCILVPCLLGVALMAGAATENSQPNILFAIAYPVRGLVTKNSLYLQNFEPSRWPVGNPETGYLSAASEQERGALKSKLFTELKAQGDPRMFGQGDVFHRYEHANKGHVGFCEKFMRGEKLKAGWVSESDFEPRQAETNQP